MNAPNTPIASDDPTEAGLDVLASTRAGGARPAPREGELPSRVGRHVVIERLGSGGMGVVLSAYDPELDRKVAIKLLHGAAAATGELAREAQALAKLSDPNVVAVYDVGTIGEGRHAGAAFVAMEYVEGSTLSGWLAARERSWREITAMFLQAARGLASAHAIGLVHRDFKPDNVLIGHDGRVRVADFGLARYQHNRGPEPGAGNSNLAAGTAPSNRITGTPAYMAPEQISGQSVDARADQFAFAVALHEAVYREPPFPRDNIAVLFDAVCHGRRRPPPRGSGVPGWLERAIARSLATAPEARFADMHALAQAIARDPARSRQRGLLAGSFVIAAVSIPLVVLHGEDDPDQLCRQGAERIDAAWSDARAERVRSAFTSAGPGWAGGAADSISTDLDRYAADWRARALEVCTATHVHGEQSQELFDLRMDCLGERRTALAALVDVLEQADATGITRATGAIAGLPSLARCDDAVALRARTPMPEDPQLVEQIGQLRTMIAGVDAEREAGSLSAALELGRSALTEAERLAFAPTLAAALLAIGSVEQATAAYDDAEEHLRRGTLLAISAGDDALLAEGAAWLVWVFGELRSQPAVARTWGELALATVAAAEVPDTRLEYRLRSNLGSTLTNEGRYDEAERMHTRALELATQLWGEGHPRTLGPRVNLASLALRRRDNTSALAEFSAAYQVARDRLGATHPTAMAIRSSEIAAMVRTRDARAQPAARELLELVERELGPEHPDLAITLHSLALALAHDQRYDEGLVLLRRALALRTKAFGVDSMPTVPIQQAIVVALRHTGELEDAKLLIDRLDRIMVENVGAEHPERIPMLMQSAKVDLARAELTGALTTIEAAVASAERNHGATSSVAAQAIDQRGTIRRAAGDLAGGLADHRRALAILEALPPADAEGLDDCRRNIAEAEAEAEAKR